MNNEVVICAAVKDTSGLVFRGHRHSDCIRTIINAGRRPSMTEESQDFVTSINRFVNRYEAKRIQVEAGIESADPGGYRGEKLYSEDLY